MTIKNTMLNIASSYLLYGYTCLSMQGAQKPQMYLKKYEPQHEISNNVVCATSKGSDQPAHTRLCKLLEYSTSVKLLTEYH